MTWKIEHNDVIEWAKNYRGEPFHSLLTDAPYHLTTPQRFGKPGSKPAKVDVYNRASKGFMSQTWDGGGIAFDPATWAALAQHLYPGAFIMAFGGSRGYHRMATAMEDAGLIIHPAMGWLTLSGFPKATRIDTQLDKAAGAEREVVGRSTRAIGPSQERGYLGTDTFRESGWQDGNVVTAPATPLAQDWAGHRYGLQALKPAFEFIAVAQVPYSGRPVDSIVATGAGSLWIDGGRIATGEDLTRDGYGLASAKHEGWKRPWNEKAEKKEWGSTNGRWPSNFLLQCGCDPNRLDPAHQENCPVRLFDEQAGESGNGNGPKISRHNVSLGSSSGQIYGKGDSFEGLTDYGDSGPASRMFHQADFSYEVAEALAGADDASEHTEVCPVRYEPKVSSGEREAGLEGLEVKVPHAAYGDFKGVPGNTKQTTNMNGQMRNNHPTLKPINLLIYLSRLLAPPEAYAPRRILIPFAGAGSEVCGALLSGQWEEIIGIEKEANYVKIAEARIKYWDSVKEKVWARGLDSILESYGKTDRATSDSQLRLPF